MAVRRSYRTAAMCAVVSLVAISALGAPASAQDPDPTPGGAPSASVPSGTTPITGLDDLDPDEVLDQVRGLFDDDTPPAKSDPTPDPSAETELDPTLALQALLQVQDELTPTQRTEARSLLKRPTDRGSDQFGDGYTTDEEAPVCSSVVCVHYVATTGDRPSLTDTNSDGVPDYVAKTLQLGTQVDQNYRNAGYRAPLGDGARGGNALPDIYLADIGDDGLFGYCATDPDAPQSRRVWAYCVVDNDYSARDFTGQPVNNLAVTLAHEYFHAVQFGYDAKEDPWFLEATATWAEDEVFDSINDNRRYLRPSPLTNPRTSIDGFQGLFPYGVWVFFRYLSERDPREQGGMPTIVRDMWRQADASPGAPNLYSLQAVRRVLEARGSSLTRSFALFSAANRVPQRNYREAVAGRYPTARPAATIRLSAGRRGTGRLATKLNHLTSATYRLKPGNGLANRNWRIKLQFNLAKQWTRPAAVVTLFPKSGAPRAVLIPLNGAGDKTKFYNFSSAKMRQVQVTLVNASDKFDCNSGRSFSCAGRPLNDRLGAAFAAKVVGGP